MAKNKLSEGQVLSNFILNEMDYYVPTMDDFEDDVAQDDYMGDSMESEFDYGYDVDSVEGDAFDDFDDKIKILRSISTTDKELDDQFELKVKDMQRRMNEDKNNNKDGKLTPDLLS